MLGTFLTKDVRLDNTTLEFVEAGSVQVAGLIQKADSDSWVNWVWEYSFTDNIGADKEIGDISITESSNLEIKQLVKK